MTLLICYTNYYGAHVFFLPGAHSMLKPALSVSNDSVYTHITSQVDNNKGEQYITIQQWTR